MTDPIRTALVQLLRDHAYNTGSAFSESHVDWLLKNSPGVPMLAAASPEPERLPGGMKRDHEGRLMPGWGDPEPAPAAPTVEALRAALVDDIRRELRRKGLVPAMTTTLRDRLIELEAAARADERTRLESLTVEAGPEPKHMPVICCRWHALAQANP